MIGRTNNLSNTSDIFNMHNVFNNYETWIGSAITSILAIIIVFGNALVFYAARTTKMDTGRLRIFDKLIKSLALNDLLVGLIVIPFRCGSYSYLGKNIWLG